MKPKPVIWDTRIISHHVYYVDYVNHMIAAPVCCETCNIFKRAVSQPWHSDAETRFAISSLIVKTHTCPIAPYCQFLPQKSACFSRKLISAGVHFPARVRNTACFFYQLLLRLLCYRGGVSRMAEAPAGLIPPKFNIDQPRFELISKNLDVF